MPPQYPPDPTARGDARGLDKDPGDADETDEYPGDADETYAARPAPPSWQAPPPPWYGGGHDGPPRPRPSRALTVAAIAVVAAAIGAGAAVGVRSWPASSPSSVAGPAAGSSPAASAPGAGNGNGLLAPGLGGNGGGEQLMAAGKVTAVSDSSVTVEGQGDTITAAITGATKFSGNVRGASGIKVGDEVMIDISVNGSTNTAASIQDPFTGF